MPAAGEPPTDWSHLARWTVITSSAMASGLGAAMVPQGSGLAVMGVLALPALGVAALEYGRARGRTLRSLGSVSFFAFIVPAVALFVGELTPARAVGAALFLASVPLILWASRRTPQIKGLPDFGLPDVFELGGVQFAVAHGVEPVGVGEYVRVLVRAQNVLEVPRNLVIRVRGDGEVGIQPQTHRVPMTPGVVRDLLVPVRVPTLAAGSVSFVVDFDVTGDRVGRRLRLQQGAEWVGPSSAAVTNVIGALTLAGAGLGAFRLGSNGVVSVKVDGTKAYASEERVIEVKDLYLPSAEELQVALQG
jgi:hypothetical protein